MERPFSLGSQYVSLQLVTLEGFTRKGLQSRSATASLLIKSFKCMKEEIELILALAQKSRHAVETCG